MSLLDDVRIVVTPNGYKAGELYAVIPSDGAADMDVTRATAATRVDENGLVNYAEVIGGEEVIDGSFPYPNTVWGGDASTVFAEGSATLTGVGAYKNLLTQTTILESGKLYEVTYTSDLSSVTSGSLKLQDFSDSSALRTVLDGTNTIQLTANGTTFKISEGGMNGTAIFTNLSVKEVTRDNVPRIDYTGGGCPHILAEPMRTNFVVTSASGNYGNAPASEILAIAPDGTNTAIRPVPDSASDRYQETIAGGTYSSGDEVTYSWYRKRFSTPVVDSYVGDLYINALVNCTQVGVATEIISEVNGFNRVSATFSITDGSIDSILRFYFGSIIGDGNSSVAYWGHQLEVGSYATSYIPNFGTVAGVTRNQDIFTRDGIGSLINSTEGVLFVEAATFENGADCRITLSDGTITNRVSIEWDILANTIKGFVGSDGNLVSPATYNQTDYNKIAIKYKENDCALWINGTEVDTDFAVSVLSGVNQLEFSNYGGSLTFEGKVKQLQVYDTALTDEQLEALTS